MKFKLESWLNKHRSTVAGGVNRSTKYARDMDTTFMLSLESYLIRIGTTPVNRRRL